MKLRAMSVASVLAGIPRTGRQADGPPPLAEVVPLREADPARLAKSERQLCSQLVQHEATIDQLERDYAQARAELVRERNDIASRLNDIRQQIADWCKSANVGASPRIESMMEGEEE